MIKEIRYIETKNRVIQLSARLTDVSYDFPRGVATMYPTPEGVMVRKYQVGDESIPNVSIKKIFTRNRIALSKEMHQALGLARVVDVTMYEDGSYLIESLEK